MRKIPLGCVAAPDLIPARHFCSSELTQRVWSMPTLFLQGSGLAQSSVLGPDPVLVMSHGFGSGGSCCSSGRGISRELCTSVIPWKALEFTCVPSNSSSRL